MTDDQTQEPNQEGTPEGAAETRPEVLQRSVMHIPFHLSDPVGVLFFGNLFHLIHQVYEDWARATPGVWDMWFSGKGGIGYPIRHAQADYLKFLHVGKEYEICVRLKSISESTFILESEFLLDEVVHATVETVHTAVDLTTQTKGKIEQGMKEFLSWS